MNNERAKTIWDKLYINKNFHKLAKKYRKLAGIPAKGFTTKEDEEKYLKTLDKNEKKSNIYTLYANKFNNEIKKIYPLSIEFDEFITGFFVNNTIPLEKINTTDCDIFHDSKKSRWLMDWIVKDTRNRSGVYIQIRPDSSMSKLIEFIEKNRTEINKLLKTVRTEEDLPKPKNERKVKFAKRDERIYQLSKKTLKELQDKYIILCPARGTSREKHILIETIIANEGFKCKSDNIRKIMSRQRKKRES